MKFYLALYKYPVYSISSSLLYIRNCQNLLMHIAVNPRFSTDNLIQSIIVHEFVKFSDTLPTTMFVIATNIFPERFSLYFTIPSCLFLFYKSTKMLIRKCLNSFLKFKQ